VSLPETENKGLATARSVSSRSFGRQRRVRKRPLFQRIQSTGKRVTSAHFIFLVAAQAEAGSSSGTEASGPSRLGLIASRRMGSAVARNRIKRLCRECFRLSPTLLPNGVDLVVIPRRGSESLKLQDVMSEWEANAGVLRRRAREALAETLNQPHVCAVSDRQADSPMPKPKR
jgi:ribonuclease P protein component